MEITPNEHEDRRTCIKVKFFAQVSRIYGIMTIVFGESKTYVEEAGINLSTYSIAYNQVSNNSSFSEFYKIVSDTKETLDSHRKTYFLLKNSIEKDLGFLEKFSKSRNKTVDVLELEADLKEIIRRAINDKKIVIFAAEERIPSQLYVQLQNEMLEQQQKVSEERYENEEEEEEEEVDFFAVDSNSSLVDCSPIVSPVGGISVAGIDEGDVIFVTLGVANKEESERDNVKNREDKPRTPAMKAAVVKSAFEGGVHKILVQIDDKTFGKIEESESVKIKVASRPQKQPESSGKKSANKGLIWLLIFIILLLLAATYVLIFVLI